MHFRWLKYSRVFVSLVFLLLFFLMLVDFTGHFPRNIMKGITWIQFIPSFLTFKNLLSFAGIGFLVVILLSLLYGRVYCSTVCPLGIYQDVVSWLRRKLSRRKRIFRFGKPYNVMRYSILILSILVFLAGNILLLNLLDPYSNFGRIVVSLVKPAAAEINNFLAKALASRSIFWLNPVELRAVNPFTLIYPSAILILVTWMSFFHGRLYCNTICPVGTFLGFLSRYSLFKIRIDKVTCDRCGKCSSSCKSQCINIKEKEVDFSRCVGCFNCLSACPSLSIQYRNSWFPKQKEKLDVEMVKTDSSKREFVIKSVAFVAGITGLSKIASAQEKSAGSRKPSVLTELKTHPVSPPGSLSIEHFTEHCTACQLCVSACPSHVLKPSVTEYGILGFMQPHMDYHASYCNYECTVCTEVCPTKAIQPLTVEQKKVTQIGKVHFIRENCIVYTDNTACAACNEHCPTQAVKMVPYKGDLNIPQVDTSICIGCGACEHACPARPYRAIYVDGNTVHQVAEKPKEEKIQEKAPEEFPF